MAPHTFRELAGVICRLDSRPSVDVEAITQQIRGAYQRNLIAVDEHQFGPRGALLVTSVYEACRARVLATLIDLGVSGESLRKINARLEVKVSRSNPDGSVVVTSFRSIVDQIATGSLWVLRLDLIRCDGVPGEPDGALAYRVDFKRPSEAIAEDPTSEEFSAVYPGTLLAHVKLPLTTLLRPMILATSNNA